MLANMNNCFIHIDDIIVHEKDKNEHDRILAEVLKRLISYKVKINFDKTGFYNTKIKILGFFIDIWE